METEKRGLTKTKQAESKLQKLQRKTSPKAPVILVENPLYDDDDGSFESDEGDQVIEKILSIIKTNDKRKCEKEGIKREEIDAEKEEDQRKEALREGQSSEEEEECDQIQKKLIQAQDFSDDEGSDEEEEYLDYNALHRTRDSILKELGLSDDDDL